MLASSRQPWFTLHRSGAIRRARRIPTRPPTFVGYSAQTYMPLGDDHPFHPIPGRLPSSPDVPPSLPVDASIWSMDSIDATITPEKQEPPATAKVPAHPFDFTAPFTPVDPYLAICGKSTLPGRRTPSCEPRANPSKPDVATTQAPAPLVSRNNKPQSRETMDMSDFLWDVWDRSKLYPNAMKRAPYPQQVSDAGLVAARIYARELFDDIPKEEGFTRWLEY
ncbi:hypothetical protein BXZ70DRAFT_932987 [Cristinia sonorae]|uniref:Uncharacterized protein n=1 Tax=Cristinia sonorae TaxID=1940300 RepID=A0A8K0XQG8_9AGAR|nr:hypothetical protein BXZ70DRAFT_932987 [Cristinia sonorae]